MADPRNPDGFTGPDDDGFEYDWMAQPATRDYSSKSRRVQSVEESFVKNSAPIRKLGQTRSDRYGRNRDAQVKGGSSVTEEKSGL